MVKRQFILHIRDKCAMRHRFFNSLSCAVSGPPRSERHHGPLRRGGAAAALRLGRNALTSLASPRLRPPLEGCESTGQRPGDDPEGQAGMRSALRMHFGICDTSSHRREEGQAQPLPFHLLYSIRISDSDVLSLTSFQRGTKSVRPDCCVNFKFRFQPHNTSTPTMCRSAPCRHNASLS